MSKCFDKEFTIDDHWNLNLFKIKCVSIKGIMKTCKKEHLLIYNEALERLEQQELKAIEKYNKWRVKK